MSGIAIIAWQLFKVVVSALYSAIVATFKIVVSLLFGWIKKW